MAYPKPEVGLVLGYHYLWYFEESEGHVEGLKNRPCTIILSISDGDDQIVTVLPITHTEPKNSAEGIEIPLNTKIRLGLDDNRSWVILNESNKFIWPGYDLRPAKNKSLTQIDYGILPPKFFNELKIKLLSYLNEGKGQIKSVNRK